jgi:hypothetical protein
LLVPLWLAFEALAVGETCPASVDVETRVRAILHLAPEQTLSESFLVERHESGLYVELRGNDAAVIGQRTLPLAGSCNELAQAAAVVLAAWLSDVHPDFAGALPAPVPTEAPPEEPPPAEEPPPEPAKSSASAAQAGSGAGYSATQVAPRARSKTYVWDLSLGVGADYSAGRFALAGIASVGRLPTETGWGVAAVTMPAAPRTRELGPGTFDWHRWPLGVGPAFRFVGSAMTVDANAGLAVAWLHFAGGAFDHRFKPNGSAWGGFLTLRGATTGRHWAGVGWLEAQYYPAESKVYASGVPDSWILPLVSLGGFVGVRYSP